MYNIKKNLDFQVPKNNITSTLDFETQGFISWTVTENNIPTEYWTIAAFFTTSSKTSSVFIIVIVGSEDFDFGEMPNRTQLS